MTAEAQRTASEVSFQDYVLSNRNENLLDTGQQHTLVYKFNQERDITHPLDDCPAMILFLRGSLPAGVFLIAKAFSNGGLFFSLFGVAFIGLMSMYNTHALVWCAHRVYQRLHVPMLAFAEVTEQCCLVGPKILNKYHTLMRIFVDGTVVLDSLLTVGALTTAIATHSQTLIEHYGNFRINVRVYTITYFPFLLCLNTIKTLHNLAPLALIANICTTFSVAGNYYYFLRDGLPPMRDRHFIRHWTRIPLFFGTAVFSLTCITLVMPIENNMRHPHHLATCPGILNIGFCISIAVTSMTGFLGYWKYGDDLYGNMNLNLPEREKFAQVCIASVITSVFLTSSLQTHVAMRIIWRNFKHKFPNHQFQAKLYIRAVVIFCCCCCAMVIPDVGIFASLVGSLSRTALCLVIPAVIELIICWHYPGLGILYWRLVKNMISIALGSVIMVSGVISNLLVLADAYS